VDRLERSVRDQPLIDDITVDNKTFSSASDNSSGDNATAGPTATTDPSLLPAFLPLP